MSWAIFLLLFLIVSFLTKKILFACEKQRGSLAEPIAGKFYPVRSLERFGTVIHSWRASGKFRVQSSIL